MTEQFNLENKAQSRKQTGERELELVKSRTRVKRSIEPSVEVKIIEQNPEKSLGEVHENSSTHPGSIESERRPETKTERARLSLKPKIDPKHQKSGSLTKKKDGNFKIPEKYSNTDIEDIEDFGDESESPLLVLNKQGGGRRISFIVRVTMDEENAPQRVEIEETQTRKKEFFHTLNGEQLAGFIRLCLPLVSMAEPVVPQESPHTKEAMPATKTQSQTSIATISDVRVIRKGANDATMALVLVSEEDYAIQASFHLHNDEVIRISTQESRYEILVYANQVGNDGSILLNMHRGNLLKGVMEYTVKLDAPHLSPGVYRLIALITFYDPNRIKSYYKGPVIQVS